MPHTIGMSSDSERTNEVHLMVLGECEDFLEDLKTEVEDEYGDSIKSEFRYGHSIPGEEDQAAYDPGTVPFMVGGGLIIGIVFEFSRGVAYGAGEEIGNEMGEKLTEFILKRLENKNMGTEVVEATNDSTFIHAETKMYDEFHNRLSDGEDPSEVIDDMEEEMKDKDQNQS
jgi:hypothetical protein